MKKFLYRCPVCKATFTTYVKVEEVVCANRHPVKGKNKEGLTDMELISSPSGVAAPLGHS